MEENLAKYTVGLFLEDGREDDGHTIRRGLDIDSFLIAIVKSHELPLAGSGRFKLFLTLESKLERSGEGITLDQGEILDEGISLLYGY